MYSVSWSRYYISSGPRRAGFGIIYMIINNNNNNTYI